MDWIRENWVFLLFFIFFLGMHLSGHGCGGHGRHGGHGHGDEEEQKGDSSSEKKEQKGGHGCC